MCKQVACAGQDRAYFIRILLLEGSSDPPRRDHNCYCVQWWLPETGLRQQPSATRPALDNQAGIEIVLVLFSIVLVCPGARRGGCRRTGHASRTLSLTWLSQEGRRRYQARCGAELRTRTKSWLRVGADRGRPSRQRSRRRDEPFRGALGARVADVRATRVVPASTRGPGRRVAATYHPCGARKG